MTPAFSLNASTDGIQYLRAVTLIVANRAGAGIDLSQFRIKFSIKQATSQTPNSADIRVYNLSEDTAAGIRAGATRVILQAGYNSNFGEVFVGNIKQVILGRESATDTFIDIIAGDGDLAYNHAVIVQSIAKGSTQNDEIKACIDATTPLGVISGGNSTIESTIKRPRGKVMLGNVRNYFRGVAKSTGYTWSIQNEKITFVKATGYLPGQAVLLTDETGMIGTPQQTSQGVNVKCLLNPFLRINGRIQLDNSTVQLIKVNLTLTPGSATNVAPPLPSNGIYVVIAAEHSGDTRGIEWYTTLVCLSFDPTNGLIGSVSNAP
jgi:hypothetical protein